MKTLFSASLALLLFGTLPCFAQEKPKGTESSTDFPDEPDSPDPVDQTTEKESSLVTQTMGGTQYAADITLMEGVPPFIPFRKEVTAWDPFAPTPLPVNSPKMKPLLPDPLEIFMRPLRNTEAWTQENLGLSWNIYYTLLYQYATRTVRQPPPNQNEYYGRSAGTGRLDLGVNWNIFDVPDVAHGQIGILMRNGVVMGQPESYRAGAAVGSLPVSPDALYWGDNTSLCLAYWQQGFYNDRFVITAGKIHPNQYIALSRIANDESRQFISGAFDGLGTLGPSLGTYAPGIAIQLVPVEGAYMNAVAIDATGGPNESFKLGDGSWWAAVQTGWVPKFKNANDEELVGNWALMIAATNYGVEAAGLVGYQTLDDNNGLGFGVMIEQQVTPEISILAEYGLSNSVLSPIQETASIVAAHLSPFGRDDDMIGVGLNWSVPTVLFNDPKSYPSPRREELFMEMFYRIQITGSMELTPDLQIVLRPATGDSDPIAIFGLRLRTQF